MPRQTSVLVSVAALLSLLAPARSAAHVTAVPSFLASGTSTTVRLVVPNERRPPLTGVELHLPEGFTVQGADALPGWEVTTSEASATWSGGSLPALEQMELAVELDVSSEPGTVVLHAVERYPDGRDVTWPVTVTVTPGNEPSQQLGVALAVGIGGLFVLTLAAALLWRRRTGPLQER